VSALLAQLDAQTERLRREEPTDPALVDAVLEHLVEHESTRVAGAAKRALRYINEHRRGVYVAPRFSK